MSMAEWDRTPWWEQRLLREGLWAEQPWIQRAALLDRVDDPLSLRSGVFCDDMSDLDGGDSDDLTGFGVQIHRSATVTPLYRPAQP
jgi:hypothetical protein